MLATGSNFPDALAGNYLAGQLSAPILLTTSTITDPNYAKVTAALALLLPGTTKRVYILGGTAAVGADVATDLTAKGYTVTRIGGATRYDTAQLVDTQYRPSGRHGRQRQQDGHRRNGRKLPGRAGGRTAGLGQEVPGRPHGRHAGDIVHAGVGGAHC